MNKIMSLGFDCTLGHVFGKGKPNICSKEFDNYEIGLFDWAESNESSLMILYDKFVSKSIKDHNYILSYGSINSSKRFEAQMFFSNDYLVYPHVVRKKSMSLDEMEQQYKDRLLYLENKTYEHFKNNGIFICNFSTYLGYSTSSVTEKEYIERYKIFKRYYNYIDGYNGKILCLTNNTTKNIKSYKTLQVIYLDNKIVLDKSNKIQVTNYQDYLINKIKDYCN